MDYRAADQDMEIQDLRDSKSVQLDSKVGEALIADVPACYAEDDEAQGFFGGIWLLWNDAKFNLRVIHCIDQTVSVCVETAREWKNLEGSVSNILDMLIPLLRKWNTQVYGQIFQKNKRILARLQGIQRVSWLRSGDRNTKFFHITTLVKRRRNRIERLKDNNGDWISSKEGLKALVVKYFHGIFLDGAVDIINSPLPSLFAHIPKADLAAVSKEVTEKEVHDALFAIGPYKAHGPNGYSAFFFFP
ncbi:PREDICTED: uncharacterized protein LOC103320900 [Prunus mume]|uniref:Uncharacterized protein LOC103320900 n=1 Tax=Prunus mume TaxID=102107 RepID=A0ABM0N813_PRUMU|nr:PREDICTED: uncharacterized protein LOC103320900 [Prunus mume]